MDSHDTDLHSTDARVQRNIAVEHLKICVTTGILLRTNRGSATSRLKTVLEGGRGFLESSRIDPGAGRENSKMGRHL